MYGQTFRFRVQGLRFKVHCIVFRVERWGMLVASRTIIACVLWDCGSLVAGREQSTAHCRQRHVSVWQGVYDRGSGFRFGFRDCGIFLRIYQLLGCRCNSIGL